MIQEIDYSKYQNLGRLHIVNKAKKEYNCRECNILINKQDKHYNQHVHPSSGSRGFPINSKVCKNCADFMINNIGIKIVDKNEKN